MFNGNETWTEKDKRIINVKTTRNNLGKLIKYNICILQSIRFIESDWLRAIMQCQDRAGVYSMWGLCRGGEGGEKVDFIQIQDIWAPVMQSGRSRWTYGKIGDSEQPISKQSAKTRKYHSIIREWSIVIGKKTIELLNNQSGAANFYWPLWGCAWDWVQVLCRSNCIVGMFCGRILIQWIFARLILFGKTHSCK